MLASAQAVPRVEFFGTLDSTNAEARRHAEQGVRGPLWLCARAQSGGKGRSGRAWYSPEGNLYATLLRPFEAEMADAALMSFVACLAVADTLDQYVKPARVTLKWPNDALLDNRKVAGVLLEAGGVDPHRWLTIGIGINVAHIPDDFRWPPISLTTAMAAQTGPVPSPEDVMTVLAKNVANRTATFERDGFDPIRTAWMARAARLGETIEARLPRETLTGVFSGLASDGALLLETVQGQRRVAAADIYFSTRLGGTDAAGH